jgi:glycerol-3-phosphate acyltransferase PlsX
LLLGINGICIIAHGGSSALAIENAIRLAVAGVKGDVMTKMVSASRLNVDATVTVQDSETSEISAV